MRGAVAPSAHRETGSSGEVAVEPQQPEGVFTIPGVLVDRFRTQTDREVGVVPAPLCTPRGALEGCLDGPPEDVGVHDVGHALRPPAAATLGVDDRLKVRAVPYGL